MSKYFCQDCEDIHELLSTPSSFWREEVEEMRTYFSQQVRVLMMDDKTVSCDCWTHPGGGESATGDVAPAATAREENQSL